MSNKSKGAAHEKKVADYLIAQGYLVERGFKKCAFIQGRMMAITKDLFAAFDILAIKYHEAVPKDGVFPAKHAYGEVRLIQVHAGTNIAVRKTKAFATWPDSECWLHIKGGWYEIHRVGGSQSVVDVNVLLKPKAVIPT